MSLSLRLQEIVGEEACGSVGIRGYLFVKRSEVPSEGMWEVLLTILGAFTRSYGRNASIAMGRVRLA